MKIHLKTSLLGLFLILAGCGGPDPATPVSRVVLVGIESFSREHVLRMIDQGELPNLSRMMREGSQARVISPDPLASTMLWSTLLTGQAAVKHRMSGDYVDIEAGTVCVPSSMRVVPTIFQLAWKTSATVASIGFPGTWPTEIVTGFNLSYGAVPSRFTEASEHTFPRDPKDRAAFPEHLQADALDFYTPVEEMDRRETSPFFILNEAEFEMLYDQPMGSAYRRENPFRDFAVTLMRDRAQVALTASLLETYPIRIAGVHLELAEALQAPYWQASYPDHYDLDANSLRRFGNTIDEGYRQLDDAIGRITEAAGENAVICVVGNRGFGNLPAPGEESLSGLIPMPSNENLLVLYGHGIARGADLGAIDLVDIAPTLLTAVDVAVGEQMDGRVLDAAFTKGFLAAHPRKSTEPYSDEFRRIGDRYPSRLGDEE